MFDCNFLNVCLVAPLIRGVCGSDNVLTVNATDLLQLRCDVTGSPVPIIHWEYNVCSSNSSHDKVSHTNRIADTVTGLLKNTPYATSAKPRRFNSRVVGISGKLI